MFGQSKKTGYEKLLELKGKKLEQRDALTNELKSLKEAITAAMLEGKDTSSLLKSRQEITAKLQNIEEEIILLQKKQPDILLAHYEEKLKEKEQEIQAKKREIEPYRNKYEKAKREFERIQTEWFSINGIASMNIDHLNMQIADLQAKIDGLKPNKEVTSSLHSVDEWLQLLRDGRIHSYMEGNDINLDEAYRIYSDEIKLLQDWGHRCRLMKKSSGNVPPKPEIIKYYSNERLKQIIQGEKEANFTSEMNTSSATKPFIKVRKVSI